MAGHAYVGTSGWNYDEWKDVFYQETPKRDWLSFCARVFTAVEINATFYRLQRSETFRRWREATPEDFRFAIKANRYLTHNKKLADPVAAIRVEHDRATALGPKLAAVLWQLPAKFSKDMARLEAFVRALKSWRAARHAVEFRDPSWFDDEVADCLRRHDIAACQSDAAGWPMWEAVTTDLVYVRLHGHETTYVSDYGKASLRAWATKARRWLDEGRDVHVYFDNTASGHAPFDAMQLIELLNASSSRRTARTRAARME
jgi:uncharacterized protein YecE (DUF72 family)